MTIGKPGHIQMVSPRGGRTYYHTFLGVDLGFYTRDHPSFNGPQFHYSKRVAYVLAKYNGRTVMVHERRVKSAQKARKLALNRAASNMPMDTDVIVVAAVTALITRGGMDD